MHSPVEHSAQEDNSRSNSDDKDKKQNKEKTKSKDSSGSDKELESAIDYDEHVRKSVLEAQAERSRDMSVHIDDAILQDIGRDIERDRS